eukprot:SAG22_NODE_8242_length_671_cov_1.763986_1_plen_163_part_00
MIIDQAELSRGSFLIFQHGSRGRRSEHRGDSNGRRGADQQRSPPPPPLPTFDRAAGSWSSSGGRWQRPRPPGCRASFEASWSASSCRTTAQGCSPHAEVGRFRLEVGGVRVFRILKCGGRANFKMRRNGSFMNSRKHCPSQPQFRLICKRQSWICTSLGLTA